MTDRELLESAAKAAGGRVCFDYSPDGYPWLQAIVDGKPQPYPVRWNPLTDDGDAFRLMVKLRMNVDWESADCVWCDNEGETVEGDDPYAATRRAIVRAAAEIGRDMK